MVADYGNHRIQVLDASFNHLMDIKNTGQGRLLQYPVHVAVNSKGEIIVSSHYTRRVSVYDISGAYCGDLLKGCRDRPGGIAVDADDTIYIAHGRTGSITVINKKGRELRTIRCGTTISMMWRLVRTIYMAYITIYNNHLIVCDTDGVLYQVDKMGSGSTKLEYVQSARGLAVDNAGDLMIVDRKGPITVVTDGIVRHVGEQGLESWQLGKPLGIAVTETGEIIVGNIDKGTLLVYTP